MNLNKSIFDANISNANEKASVVSLGFGDWYELIEYLQTTVAQSKGDLRIEIIARDMEVCKCQTTNT